MTTGAEALASILQKLYGLNIPPRENSLRKAMDDIGTRGIQVSPRLVRWIELNRAREVGSFPMLRAVLATDQEITEVIRYDWSSRGLDYEGLLQFVSLSAEVSSNPKVHINTATKEFPSECEPWMVMDILFGPGRERIFYMQEGDPATLNVLSSERVFMDELKRVYGGDFQWLDKVHQLYRWQYSGIALKSSQRKELMAFVRDWKA